MEKENETVEWKPEILEIIHEECSKIIDEDRASQPAEGMPDSWKKRLILSLQEECEQMVRGESEPSPCKYVLNGYFGEDYCHFFDNAFLILLQGVIEGEPDMLFLFAEYLNYRGKIYEYGEYVLSSEMAQKICDRIIDDDELWDNSSENYDYGIHSWVYEIIGGEYWPENEIWRSGKARDWKLKYLSPVYWYMQAAGAGSDAAKLWCAYCMDTGTAGFRTDHEASEKMLAEINDMPDSLNMKGFEFLLKTAIRLNKEYADADLWEDEMCLMNNSPSPVNYGRWKSFGELHDYTVLMLKYRNIVRMFMADLGLVYLLWDKRYYSPEFVNDGYDRSCKKISEQKGNWYHWCADRGFSIPLL